MQRCVPSIVQSRIPVVPRAQPSHTPFVRIRQAKGSSLKFSQTIRAISRK